MKKRIAAILSLALCLALPLNVLAQSARDDALLISTTVIPTTETALKAPATGELAPYTVRVGDQVNVGDTLFTVEPQSVYADVDGTVAVVYAQAGDIADAAVERYGAVLAIERVDRYELNCNVMTGHNTEINRNVYVGTKVYLRSLDKNHFADGVITAVNGKNFTVAVIGGDLRFNKDVKVYRDDTYEAEKLLARASLSVVAPVSVSASGTILTMNVQKGAGVKAGDLLFTYVPDALDPELRGKANATTVKADGKSIISAINVSQGASVQKGQALCTVYQVGDYQLSGEVDEGDYASIAVGDTVSVTFEELGIGPVSATVASISPYGSAADTSRYTVYFDFDAPEGVLVGMHATVEK